MLHGIGFDGGLVYRVLCGYGNSGPLGSSCIMDEGHGGCCVIWSSADIVLTGPWWKRIRDNDKVACGYMCIALKAW